jgi:hypothetical protein
MGTMVYSCGGVQMVESEYRVLRNIANRGTCIFCLRRGLTGRYGSQKKHMNSCSQKLTLLEKEKVFAHLIADAKAEERD